MCPFSGERIKLFHIHSGKELTENDVRLPVIKHMEHELEGVFPPLNGIYTDILWAEVGVIIDNEVVWICIPIKKELTEAVYKKAVDKANSKADNEKMFTYNELTKRLKQKGTENSHADSLIKSHFFTVHFSNGICDILKSKESTTPCDNQIKVEEESKSVLNAIVSSMGCDCTAFCKLMELIRTEFEIKEKLAHTFFLIFRPGAHYFNDIEILKEHIIGGVLIHWDKKVPSREEILYLRRSIINTIWLELGEKLQILKLEKLDRLFFQLAKLTIEKKPFFAAGDHNDTELKYRRSICEIFADSNKELCDQVCPSSAVAINRKAEDDNFCATLSKYKCMFEHKDKSFYFNADEKDLSYPAQLILLKVVAGYLGLDMEICAGISTVKLPYGPSWLFLATIRQLSEILTNPTIKVISNASISICFNPTTENGGTIRDEKEIQKCVENLQKSVAGKIHQGDTTKAIIDVLHGRLGSRDSLRSCLFGIYPNEQVVKYIIEGSSVPLIKFKQLKITKNDGKIILTFSWQ